MSAPAQPFIDYLQQLQRQGETHVHLDEQAKLVLREFYKKAMGITEPAPPKATQSAPQESLVKEAAQPYTTDEATPSQVTSSPAPTQSNVITASGKTPADKINSLKAQAQNWAAIKELGTLKDKLVFSTGNPEADIMFVGEAPGFHDEKEQQPFAGPAGKKLDGILKAMGLSRDEVYISNIVKFRPAMENQTTGNRKPTTEEIIANKGFIALEMKIVNPKVIISVGATASQILLKSDQPLESLRGKFHKPFGIPIRATYHPSYLLHNEGNADKRKVWEDMLATMELLDMPITDRQKKFFT